MTTAENASHTPPNPPSPAPRTAPEATAFTFPGQGSQRVGMTRALVESYPDVRELVSRADRILGYSLSRIMWDGPDEALERTVHAQPALVVAGLAVATALNAEGADVGAHGAFLAGHSLGEYTAATLAGVLTLDQVLPLVRARAEAMQQAVPQGEGSMAAILGLDIDTVRRTLEARPPDPGQVVAVANDNAPGQVVVSGHAPAVDEARTRLLAQGARRVVMLKVSAPFHCPLMEPAAAIMKPLLEHTTMNDPRLPVVTNVSAAPCQQADRIRQNLAEQITAPVRWRESLLAMHAAGVRNFVELGPGGVLTGLTRRTIKEAQALAVETPEQVAEFAERLRKTRSHDSASFVL